MARAKKRQPWETVFSRIRVWKFPKCMYPSRPTAQELDAVEKVLGYCLPASYRVFVERFGLGGELVGWVRLDPLTGKKDDFFTVAGRTRFWRDEFAQYAENTRRVGESFAKQLVAFGSTGGGDSFAFHTGEVTDRKRPEYKVYQLGRLGDWKELQGESFTEFVEHNHRLTQTWRATEEQVPVDLSSPIMYYPSASQRRLPFTKKDIAGWLAWNNGTARDLALSIRDHGQTGAFPILADALEEAGCTNHDLLDSCRHGDPDIDGVWALAVLLGNNTKK